MRVVVPFTKATAIITEAIDEPDANAVTIPLIEEEIVAESPPFAPAALVELAARGFVRLNRWAK